MPETVTPVVPAQDPNQGQLHVEPVLTPWSAMWWLEQVVTNIPYESVGWLVSQGWKITAISYDNTTVPPTPYYAMARDTLQNMYVLQSLLNEYTFAYNTAMGLNEVRYNQVVANWTEMLSTSQTHFQAEIDEQNAHALLFLGNLDTYMQEVDDLIEANQTKIVDDALTATTALTAMDEKLADLETNASDNATTIGDLLTAQGDYLATFLDDFSGKLGELNDNYSAHLDKMETLLSDANTDVQTFVLTQTPAIQELKDAYTLHAQTLNDLLTTAGTYLTDISNTIDSLLTSNTNDYSDVDTDINAILNDCTTVFDSYSGDYDEVLGLLVNDYDAHAILARDFLDDLGSTELARINEAFTASLTTQLQDLTNRGIYSSAVAVDFTARNVRDRDEQIAALNDRLAREKLENQHRLYGQQTAMRAATMAGHDRAHSVEQEVLHYKAAQITGLYQLLTATRERTLNMNLTLNGLKDGNLRLNVEIKSKVYELGQGLQRLLIEEAGRLQQLQQSVRQWTGGQRDALLGQIQQNVTQHLAGIDKQHAAQQDISRVAMTERDQLLGQLQEAVKGFLTGKERYAATTMQTASTLGEHQHRVIVEKMNEYAAKLEGRRGQHADAMKLMAYQLDTRNQLLIGLYGFVERRTDEGPSFKDLAQVCTALGDAGGGWVTP